MLQSVDLNKALDAKDYSRELVKYQVDLRRLAYQLYMQKRSLIIVYEGWDAGGKGGNIRRITEKLDPRGYHVYSIGAPKGEEKTHHYLWRFWRCFRPPEDKQLVIFDRSWYGRVLVERIEGFATEVEWRRSYREIIEFERHLTDFGILLVKFWLHIGKDEQLRRFEARQAEVHKRWKLTDEDWRNREKWDQYEEAVNDMLVKTSTIDAPWTILEGNDKYYARIKALKTVVDVLSGALDNGGNGSKKKKDKK